MRRGLWFLKIWGGGVSKTQGRSDWKSWGKTIVLERLEVILPYDGTLYPWIC